MLEIIGNICDMDGFKVIPTNGTIKKNGEAVMGSGLALQLRQKYPDFPSRLGLYIEKCGNIVEIFFDIGIVCFPVKRDWWEKADLTLIEDSAQRLRGIVCMRPSIKFFIPHVGCGNGGLNWKDVKPVLEKHLGDLDNIVIVKEGKSYE